LTNLTSTTKPQHQEKNATLLPRQKLPERGKGKGEGGVRLLISEGKEINTAPQKERGGRGGEEVSQVFAKVG